MSENNSNFIKSNREQIVFGTLLALVLVIYWQTVGFGFINLDDNLYVYDNTRIANGLTKDTINWAFSAFYSANWHPLTWLSHALDIQLFGLNAGGHHAVNVFIHLINSILSFIVFRKMTGSFWKSAIVAALFAVHPAHVESVVWISERKDVLSTLFWLLTMLVYFKYAEKKKSVKVEPINKENQIPPPQSSVVSSTYFLLICLSLLFALGLMAKPMLVTLPFVLLLCDFWALERLKALKDLPSLIIEKLPLFILSILSSYITILAQKSYGAVESLEVLSVQTRIFNAIVAYAKYLITFFYPANLAVWYPYDKNISALQIIGSIVFLATVTGFCAWQIRDRKYLLMGWLWFLGTLVPVIGLVQVGSQSMADRYTYVPFFGLFVMFVWGISDILKKFSLNKKMFVPIFGIVIIIFTILSFIQTSYWKNSETLYRHTLAVTKNNHLIAHNLCHSLMLEERLSEALPLCLNSIEYNPNYYSVYNTLGTVQTKLGKFAEAEQSFRTILSKSPDYTVVYTNLSVALSMQGKTEEAEDFLRKATEMDNTSIPKGIWINSFNSLAIAFASQKKYEKATENFARVLFIAPERSDVRANYALTLSSIQKYDEAQKQIEESIRQNPNIAEFYNVYGVVLLGKIQKTEAVKQFEKALQLKPDFSEAKSNLEKAKK